MTPTPKDDPPSVEIDAEVENVQKRTCHFLKINGASPSLYVRYGENQWTAKIGTRERPVYDEKTIWVLERLFQDTTQ